MTTSKLSIDQNLLAAFKKKITKHKILTCIIQVNDEVVFEHYKNEKMKEALQTINSVTKTVLSTLYGIALKEGFISNLNEPIQQYYPDYSEMFSHPNMSEITIKHLLTMSTGFDWPEFGSWQFFAPYVFDEDPVGYILKRPFETIPGEKMNYNSGCSHLLADILQKKSDMKLHDFAKTFLFKPLKIEESIWHEKVGVALGSDGLRIKASDLMKIANLWLHKGTLDHHVYFDASWVDQAIYPYFKTYQIGSYGYHIWSDVFTYKSFEVPFYFALGYGGQYMLNIPLFNLSIVMTSRLYKDSMFPLFLIKSFLINPIIDSILEA